MREMGQGGGSRGLLPGTCDCPAKHKQGKHIQIRPLLQTTSLKRPPKYKVILETPNVHNM